MTMLDEPPAEETPQIPGTEPVAAPLPPDPYNGIPGIEEITEMACRRIESELPLRGSDWQRRRTDAREAYAGNMAHRARLGGIFAVERTNLSMNVPARFIRLMAAKYSADLIGARPFFATMPAKIRDKEMAKIAKQVEAKVQDEIWASNLQPVLSESIRVALTEGERAIKIGWLQDETEYPGPAEVAVLNGQPIKTPRGQYVFRNDDLIRVVAELDDKGIPTGRPLRTLAPEEQPAEGETVEVRLKKEPGYLFTSKPVWQKFDDLPQTLVNWSGLYAAGLFSEDFLYPVNVSSLRDPACDIMVHRYDMPLDDVVAEYQNAGFEAKWRAHRSGALSQASAPQGGEEASNDALRPMLNIHETYFKVRLPGARKPSWLFIVIDYLTRMPIYAEYLGKLKMKRPPFILLRGLESVPGRAYGMGVYEKFWDKHCSIDMLFVRAKDKNSTANSIDFLHMGGIQEILDNQPFEVGAVGNGQKLTYHIPANSQGDFGAKNPPYFRVNLNEMNEGDFELMVRLIESGELEFGYLSAANETTKASDTTTATEVRNVERTGNILHESSEALISGDIESVLEIVTDVVLENADLEDFQYVEDSEELAGLNPDEIRNMERDVRLLRSKQSAADQIEVNTAAKAAVLEYYALPKRLQKKTRDFYLEIMASYKIGDGDDKLIDPTEEEIAAEAQASVQPQPPSVNIRLADVDVLAPSERQQFMQKFLGINAASPAEVMAVAQQKQAMAIEEQKIKLLAKPGEESAPPAA